MLSIQAPKTTVGAQKTQIEKCWAGIAWKRLDESKAGSTSDDRAEARTVKLLDRIEGTLRVLLLNFSPGQSSQTTCQHQATPNPPAPAPRLASPTRRLRGRRTPAKLVHASAGDSAARRSLLANAPGKHFRNFGKLESASCTPNSRYT